MSRLVIKYTSPHGRQEETKYTTDEIRIDFFMRAASEVDLSELKMCSKLEVLELSKNQLESVDLKPLRNCRSLKRLRLRDNRLKSIDLWPLVNDKKSSIDFKIQSPLCLL